MVNPSKSVKSDGFKRHSKENRYGKKLHYLGCKGSKAHSEGNK
jgi:hypothetical protein